MSYLEELSKEWAFHYQEGELRGAGLYALLCNELWQPAPVWARTDKVRRQHPGSKPPGWRADVSDLLLDVDTECLRWRDEGGLLEYHYTQQKESLRLLRWLPTLVERPEPPIRRADAVDLLVGWKMRARAALGLVAPSVALRVTCPLCGEYSLRVPADIGGDVRCITDGCLDEVTGRAPVWPRERWVALLWDV